VWSSPSQYVAGCAAPLSKVRSVHRIDEIHRDHSAFVKIVILGDFSFVACMPLKPRADVVTDFVRSVTAWMDN
jgi:hypothetical protein